MKYDELDVQMDYMGALGWELVSARRAVSDDGGLYELILKKKLPLLAPFF